VLSNTAIARSLLFPGLAVIIVAMVCAPLIAYGPQTGHSLDFNLSWASAFSSQLLSGDLYPRWLMNLNEGAGSPVFFFYAPVPFYIATTGFLVCGDCTPATQLGIGEALILLGSCLSFYCFARRYGTRVVALAGALFYAFAPYHFAIDVLNRQAIGEAAAYIWIPLILMSIDRIADGKRAIPALALTYGLLVMTHLPSALLASLFLPPYALIRRFGSPMEWVFTKCAAGIGSGILLAGIYLVPALLSQEYISGDENWQSSWYLYHRWFLLDGVDAPDPVFEQRLLATALATSALCVGAWIIAYWSRNTQDGKRALALEWMLFIAGAWFLMLPISRFFWELVPPLQKVQFPWRVLVIVDVAAAATVVLALQRVQNGSRRTFHFVLSMAAMLLLLVPVLVGISYRDLAADPAQRARLLSYLSTGRDAAEYIPSTVQVDRSTLLTELSHTDRVHFSGSAGSVEVRKWEPREIVLTVALEAATTLQVKQFHYPGWQATMGETGSKLEVGPRPRTGLLQVMAPPGQYSIVLKLTPLWQETVGAGLSAGAALCMLVLQLWPRLRRHRSAD
jgi:hypothetical protein